MGRKGQDYNAWIKSGSKESFDSFTGGRYKTNEKGRKESRGGKLTSDASNWFDVAQQLYGGEAGNQVDAQRMAVQLAAANRGVNRFYRGMTINKPTFQRGQFISQKQWDAAVGTGGAPSGVVPDKPAVPGGEEGRLEPIVNLTGAPNIKGELTGSAARWTAMADAYAAGAGVSPPQEIRGEEPTAQVQDISEPPQPSSLLPGNLGDLRNRAYAQYQALQQKKQDDTITEKDGYTIRSFADPEPSRYRLASEVGYTGRGPDGRYLDSGEEPIEESIAKSIEGVDTEGVNTYTAQFGYYELPDDYRDNLQQRIETTLKPKGLLLDIDKMSQDDFEEKYYELEAAGEISALERNVLVRFGYIVPPATGGIAGGTGWMYAGGAALNQPSDLFPGYDPYPGGGGGGGSIGGGGSSIGGRTPYEQHLRAQQLMSAQWSF